MNRATAVQITKQHAPELVVKPDHGYPHIDVARSMDSLQVHSIMIPQDEVGDTEVCPEQQRDVLINGLNNARRILPVR